MHDWLVSGVGGGEKVLEALHKLFPSPIYTLLQDPKQLKGTYFQDLEIISSFLQKAPFAKSHYKNYLPFFPLAIESMDLKAFDLIISSSHCAAKGVITSPDQLHICYCHTPMRYAWDLMHEYLREYGGIKRAALKLLLHYLRGWDVHSSKRVDHFIANSKYVAKRIEKFYGRESHLIYPPVDVSYFQEEGKKEGYYVTVSRFVPYKKIDLIVEAFSQMKDQRLLVIGDGPEGKKIKEKGASNIEFLGYQPRFMMKNYLQRAKGFIFAAVEDFGIAPVEAMACGTPVIAYRKGGACETVIEGKTGIFFEEQSAKSLIEAIRRFERMEFTPQDCRKRAEEFSEEKFNQELAQFVLSKKEERQTK